MQSSTFLGKAKKGIRDPSRCDIYHYRNATVFSQVMALCAFMRRRQGISEKWGRFVGSVALNSEILILAFSWRENFKGKWRNYNPIKAV